MLNRAVTFFVILGMFNSIAMANSLIPPSVTPGQKIINITLSEDKKSVHVEQCAFKGWTFESNGNLTGDNCSQMGPSAWYSINSIKDARAKALRATVGKWAGVGVGTAIVGGTLWFFSAAGDLFVLTVTAGAASSTLAAREAQEIGQLVAAFLAAGGVTFAVLNPMTSQRQASALNKVSSGGALTEVNMEKFSKALTRGLYAAAQEEALRK